MCTVRYGTVQQGKARSGELELSRCKTGIDIIIIVTSKNYNYNYNNYNNYYTSYNHNNHNVQSKIRNLREYCKSNS